mgnify:CR=1 FL=1|tara:strand:- start:3606 stop:4202 length:597 start_codon:yes stop_codon:yes gene_type:complete
MNNSKLTQLRERFSRGFIYVLKIFSYICSFSLAKTAIGMMAMQDGDENASLSGPAICMIIMSVFFAIAGYNMNNKKPQYVSNSDKESHYISLILNQGHTDVDTIAALAKETPNQVMDDLQHLLNTNRLVGWQLDPKAKALRKLKADVSGGQRSFKNTTLSFTCEGCGAKNNLILTDSSSSECEFCGLQHTDSLKSAHQ